jgi:hypothetical protein
MLTTGAVAQTKTKTKPKAAKVAATSEAAVTAEDIKALRDALAAQQQQIQMLRDEMARRDAAAQQQLNEVRSQAQAASEAANKPAPQPETDVNALKEEVEALKLNQQNAALSSQDDQKRIVAAEGLLGRFRWSGDLRVRGESFMQDTIGCTAACNDRYRARIRARFGFEGKLNEDFIAGIYMATGAVVNGAPDFKDPVSTNETLTSFFERKTIGLDRGYITWQPQKWKWVTATGGKFAANWQKTVITFDNDLNPEGFTVKLSKDLHTPFLKNVTLQPLLLFYNEVGGGPDSNAVGGQFLTRWQVGKYITITPSYTLLNWNGSDAIAQAAFPVSPLPQPNTPAVGTPLPQPTTQPIRIISANSFTNLTIIKGTGTGQTRGFLSDFMYGDLVTNVAIKTPWARFPVTLTGEYLDNMRSRTNQDTAFFGEFSIGQTRNKNDFQVGYSFAHIEADAVISQFNESDYRAPTNVIQHRTFVNYALSPSVTASWTLFMGRTLDTSLPNAVRLATVPVGAQEPFLKRMQLDLVYRF